MGVASVAVAVPAVIVVVAASMVVAIEGVSGIATVVAVASIAHIAGVVAAATAKTVSLAAVGGGVHKVGKAEAGAVVTMSGLPIETLLQIWSLADLDGDDKLDMREYLLCCFLVQRSVQLQLPQTLLPRSSC